MKLVEIFRSGKHIDSHGVSREFSEADLDAIASGYSPDRFRAPFLEGHNEDRPNRGLVKRVIRLGRSLFAEPYQVDDGFKNEVNGGGWPALSSAFYSPDDPRNYNQGSWSLRHVAAVQIPAVKGMEAPEFGEVPDAMIAIDFAEPQIIDAISMVARETANILTGLRDILVEQFGAESISAVMPAWQLDSLRMAAEMAQEAYPTENPIFEEAHTMTEEELQQREADLAKREAALAQQEADLVRSEFAQFCETLLAEGRQFSKESAIATYMALPTDPVEFGEKGETKQPRELYKEQLKAIPKTVEFREVADPATAPTPKSFNQAEFNKAADDYAKEHSATFGEAARKIEQQWGIAS